MATVILQGRSDLYKKGLLSDLRSLAGKIENAWKRHLHYQKVVRELGYYTDRQLADVGIARSDIPTLARESASQIQHS